MTIRALIIIFSVAFSTLLYSQDVVPERTTRFSIKVNRLKEQTQINNVTAKVSALPYVSQVSLTWADYVLYFNVKEGGDYGSFDVTRIKEILLSEGVEIVKINRTTVNE